MSKWLWGSLHRVLVGVRLTRAIEQNEKAADELDALLREVIRK